MDYEDKPMAEKVNWWFTIIVLLIVLALGIWILYISANPTAALKLDNLFTGLSVVALIIVFFYGCFNMYLSW